MAGMRIADCIVDAFLLQQPNGCDQTKPAASALPQESVSYQRFLPIPPQSGVIGLVYASVALDTKTGQLCKTYIPEKGDLDIPTCLSLSKDSWERR